MTDESSQSGPVDSRKTPDNLFVAVQPQTPLRDFCNFTVMIIIIIRCSAVRCLNNEEVNDVKVKVKVLIDESIFMESITDLTDQ